MTLMSFAELAGKCKSSPSWGKPEARNSFIPGLNNKVPDKEAGACSANEVINEVLMAKVMNNRSPYQRYDDAQRMKIVKYADRHDLSAASHNFSAELGTNQWWIEDIARGRGGGESTGPSLLGVYFTSNIQWQIQDFHLRGCPPLICHLECSVQN